MIYEMARDIGARLAARKFPVRVVYGPERTRREGFDPIVVIERDRRASDRVAPPSGQQSNPRKFATRFQAVSATVYVRSSLNGAMIQDHERDCENLVDALIVALLEWQVSERAGTISITEARYVSRDEIETWPGVAYVLRFQVPRAVYALTYDGQAKPTFTAFGFSNKTHVTQVGSDDDPETGCGAEDT